MNSAQPMSLKGGFPAMQKGSAQGSGVSSYRSKGGDVTLLSCEWEESLTRLPHAMVTVCVLTNAF